MAQIDKLNNTMVTMVSSEDSSNVTQQQQQGLTRELEYIHPNEESHENIDTNPWAGAANGDQFTLPNRMNTVDLFEQENHVDIPSYTWEADANTKACRLCTRKFGFMLRRHHCRRCGLVVCDKCSPWKVYLKPTDILQDPEGTLESLTVLASQQQRICEKCYIQHDNENY